MAAMWSTRGQSICGAPQTIRRGWAVLEATSTGYTVERRTAPYDLPRVVEDLTHERHPATGWLRGKMTR